MADYVFTPPAIVGLPIADSSQLFPVRRVYCVGRNYAEHAKEMGFTGREDPFFFCKPADALVPVATGQATDVSQVAMTVERAVLELQMATQIRNKAVEAYQDIYRMQV